MQQFDITGMSCAACSARIEKAVSKLDGVTECSVNLLTNSMKVDGSATEEEIINAVEAAGYGAYSKNAERKKSSSGKAVQAEEQIRKSASALKARLTVSVILLLLLMYVSMGHTMFGFPLPSFLAENPVSQGILQLILSAAVMVVNQKFFINGVKGIMNKSPNMDTLVALGSFAAFIYSVYSLFLMSDAQNRGNLEEAHKYLHEFYFEAAAMILALITVGKMLESIAKGKTTDALKSLMDLSPKTANIVRDGNEITVPVEEVIAGDIFIMRPGESIPVDGVVIEGESAVNESALTGESIPIDKSVNDRVSAATINQSGFLKCRATRVGEDTTLSQIIKMVSDAQATKAPISKIADKVSGIFVPVVLVIAAITFVVWMIAGYGVGFAVARSISVLVISCPCALGLATPVAIMVGSGVGAKNGILFKTAVSLEKTGKIKKVALDKTGTVTLGEPRVTDIIPAEGYTERFLLSVACALENKSEHPLAKAVMKKAAEENIYAPDASEFAAVSGNGVTARFNIDGKDGYGYGGNTGYVGEYAVISENLKNTASELALGGKTPLFFAFAGEFIGIIAVADIIKSDSAEAVKELKNMGISVVMLTGDNERTAKAIGDQVGITEIISGVLPDGKQKVIENLKKDGTGVIMVGDGINDAPALVSADIGMAIGAGTDVAVDSADVVLMKNGLSDVVKAIRLSRGTIRNIHENLFWAFIYNIIGIPIAAGVWYIAAGLTLNPMLGAAAMSLSSFCVVLNALRLNFVRLGKKSSGENNKEKTDNIKKEKENMETVMKIEGMMCSHCEATVKKCLEELPSVTEAKVDHKTGTAVVKLKEETDFAVLKKAVEDHGYKVL